MSAKVIKCAVCGRPMPCGHRSCDRAKNSVHAAAMARTVPSRGRKLYFLPTRSRG